MSFEHAIIQTIITDVKSSHRKVYLNYSGGSDSTLLLFMLRRFGMQDLELLTVSNSDLYVAASTEIAQSFFPEYKHTIIPCPPFTETAAPYVSSYLGMRGFNKKEDLVYTAFTKVPEDVHIEGRPPVRTTQAELSTKPWIRAPFSQLTKAQVVSLVDAYMPLEALKLTQSCSTARGHCMQCWPCKERLWAFNANGYDMGGNKCNP